MAQDDIRNRFHLPPLSPNVQKIAQLVSGRESAPMDEIVKILNCDASLSTRIITMAYPRVAARAGATVESAVSRLGIEYLIVLLIGELLSRAVKETFATMVSIKLEIGDPAKRPADRTQFHAAFVDFTGRANGRVLLEFSPELGYGIASRLLGETNFSAELLTDAIGELVNIVTGNLQSQLDALGLGSKMQTPKPATKAIVEQKGIAGSRTEDMYFFEGPLDLCVHLCIKTF